MLRIAIPYGTLNTDAAAQAGPHRRAPTTRATATSPPAPTCSSTGSSCATRRTSWTHLAEVGHARHPDLAATASATSPPTPTPAPRPTRSTIRASGPRRSASGRPCTRSSRYLPRKFKIAVTAAAEGPRGDQAPTTSACTCSRARDGALGFEVMVGGGLGRTPYLGPDDPPVPAGARACSRTWRRSCASTTATAGATTSTRRASRCWSPRLGAEEFARQVEAEWDEDRRGRRRPAGHRAGPHPRAPSRRTSFETLPARSEAFEAAKAADPAFARFARNNVKPHKVAGYAIVDVSLKATGETPGDATAEQMEAGRRPRRALLARTTSGSPTSRTWCCRT